MRALIWIATGAMIIWGGYWFSGRAVMQSVLENGIEQARADGWQITDNGRSIAGFPNRFDLTVDSPKITAPDGRFTYAAPFFQMLSLSYAPWHVIFALPPEQQVNGATIVSSKMQASLSFRPSPDLPLDRFVLAATGVTQAGSGIAISDLRVAAEADPTATNAYRLGFEALQTTLPAGFGPLPAMIERIRIDATAQFDRPLDRSALATPARPTEITLREAVMNWGTATIVLDGRVTIGANGTATGPITLRMPDWQSALAALVAAGVIKPEAEEGLRNGLQNIATQAGNTEVLEVPMTLSEGSLQLGLIPLLQIPALP